MLSTVLRLSTLGLSKIEVTCFTVRQIVKIGQNAPPSGGKIHFLCFVFSFLCVLVKWLPIKMYHSNLFQKHVAHPIIYQSRFISNYEHCVSRKWNSKPLETVHSPFALPSRLLSQIMPQNIETRTSNVCTHTVTAVF